MMAKKKEKEATSSEKGLQLTGEELVAYRTYVAAALTGLVSRLGIPLGESEQLLAFSLAADMLSLEQKHVKDSYLPEK